MKSARRIGRHCQAGRVEIVAGIWGMCSTNARPKSQTTKTPKPLGLPLHTSFTILQSGTPGSRHWRPEPPDKEINGRKAGWTELSWDAQRRPRPLRTGEMSIYRTAPRNSSLNRPRHNAVKPSNWSFTFFPWLSDLCADTLIICNERLHLFIGIKSSFNAL